MNREKFLEQLNITSNWRAEGICLKGEHRTLLSFIRISEKEKQLIASSPDTLCDMVEMAKTALAVRYALSACGEAERKKYGIQVEKFIETIEKATGRTWEEVCKIAAECKE